MNMKTRKMYSLKTILISLIIQQIGVSYCKAATVPEVISQSKTVEQIGEPYDRKPKPKTKDEWRPYTYIIEIKHTYSDDLKESANNKIEEKHTPYQPRLKSEDIHKKVEIYTEEGYDRGAYDHRGYDKVSKKWDDHEAYDHKSHGREEKYENHVITDDKNHHDVEGQGSHRVNNRVNPKERIHTTSSSWLPMGDRPNDDHKSYSRRKVDIDHKRLPSFEKTKVNPFAFVLPDFIQSKFSNYPPVHQAPSESRIIHRDKSLVGREDLHPKPNYFWGFPRVPHGNPITSINNRNIFSEKSNQHHSIEHLKNFDAIMPATSRDIYHKDSESPRNLPVVTYREPSFFDQAPCLSPLPVEGHYNMDGRRPWEQERGPPSWYTDESRPYLDRIKGKIDIIREEVFQPMLREALCI